MNTIRKSILVFLLCAFATVAPAAPKQWTGDGATLNWSDSFNWSDFAAPGFGDVLYFESILYPAGSTNVQGAINNIVSTSTAVGAARYSPLFKNNTTTNFYTTLIPGGVTLTLGGVGAGNLALSVGDEPDLGSYLNEYRVTSSITGAGSLVINEPDGMMYVGVGGTTGAGETALLDMSGLDNFTANLGILRICALSEYTGAFYLPAGQLNLGRTNVITADGVGGPGILLGANRSGSGSGQANINLGQVNFFRTSAFVVGGPGSYQSRVLMTNFPNSTFKLRGLNGVAPVPVLSMADQSADVTTFNPDWKLVQSAQSGGGLMDLSGGTVDIIADSIFIGRSSPANAPNDTSAKSATGFLNLGNGTVTTTNLYLGFKYVGGTNINNTTGNLILISNTSFTVYQDVYAVNRTNSGPGGATINVSNKASLKVVGNLYQGLGGQGVTIRVLDATNTYGGIVPTNVAFGINVANGGLVNIGGSLNGYSNTAIALTSGGEIRMSSGGNLTIGSLTGDGFITNAGTITVSNTFNVGAAGVIDKKSLYLGNNLNLSPITNMTFDLSANTTVGNQVNDYANVIGNVAFRAPATSLNLNFLDGLVEGTYTLMDYASSTGTTPTYTYPTRASVTVNNTGTQLQINVANLSAVQNLVWLGSTAAGGNNWNVNASSFWTNLAAASLDKFYQLDNVIFDDTALTNSFTISSNVQPSSVTFNNNTINFTNTGTGRIIGATGITKNGAGRLILSAAHDFFGHVQLNGGVTTIGNASAFGSTSSHTGTVAIASGATLDLSPLNFNAVTAPRRYTVQGTGVGGLGALYSTNPATLNNSGITLAGNTSVVISNRVAANGTLTLQGFGHPSSNIGSNTAVLDLGGYTLTAWSTNIFFTPPAIPGTITGTVSIVNMRISNGSIDVPAGCLQFGPAFVDGTGSGSINLANNTILRFAGYNTFNGATGYVAKPIIIASNATLYCSDVNAYSIPVSSPITLTGPNGLLALNHNQPMTLSGTISGGGALTKTGTGRLTLGGANTHTGSLTIDNGGLTVAAGASLTGIPLIQFGPGANNNLLDVSAAGLTLTQPLIPPATILGNLTVGSGGTLVGNTTVGGSLTIATGSEVVPGGTNLLGSIIVSNDLSLTGGHLTWEIAPSFDASDRIVVNGNLNLTGLTKFKIGSIGGFSPDGTNTLITYTGTLTGGLANLTNINPDARFVVEFVDPASTPGKIQVYLKVPPADLVWKGNDTANPTWWDLKLTTNWLNGATPDIFWSADSVTFDDTSSTNVVDLRGSLIGPSSIRMNNSGSYLFRGSAALIASSLTNDGTGSLVISNSANNQIVGAGIVLNSGTMTFSQPTNTTLTAKLSGGGALAKAGTSTLTVISADSTNFTGTVALNGGTLRLGSINTLGDSSVTAVAGTTLDLNGQVSDLAAVTVGGDGVGGLGAVDNRGAQTVLTALNNLTLSANTTLAATTNSWGITTVDTNGTPGTFLGHNYKLTKTGAKELWIATRSDTELGDIDIATNSGRLVFAGLGTQMGDSSANVVVRTNAQLGFANGIQATGKNVTLQPGGSIYVFGGTNQFGGAMVMSTNGVSTNGIVWTDFNAELTLSGNLSGPAGLQLRSTAQPGTAGRLILSGTNSYTGRTRVTDGTLAYASTNAFSGTNIVLAGRVTANVSGTPVLQLISNVVSPSSVRLEMNVGGDTNLVPGLAYSKCELTGEGGTWGGPIFIGGSSNKQSQVYFSGGSLGLTVSGPINGTNFIGTTLDSNGGCHLVGESASIADGQGPALKFEGPLYINGSVLMTQTGLGGNPYMTKLFLGSAGNNWDFLLCQRGMIQIGAHNAIPLAPISLGNGFPSADHRVVFDLNGYNQAIASLSVLFGDNDPFWFGNSSTNSNSILTYAGTGTNLWSGFIVDALDTNAPVQKTTALSVTSGYLMLRPIPAGHLDRNNFFVYQSGSPYFNMDPYTGPTTVSGGTLHVNRNLGPSPVLVTGGMLCGSNGVFLGPVTIAAGGTLAPGQPVTPFGLGGLGSATPIGSLIASNNLSLGGTCVMDVNLTTGTYDQLVVAGNLTYGGTLVINNLGTQVITNGTILPLFSAATYTAGTVVVQPAPGFGLRWDTSFLAVDGTLRVAPVNTTPIPITATVSGGGTSLNLSWPADHIGWLLQGQTNGLGVGITTNWFGVAGSTITNQIQVPIAPGNPAVFFRLIHP